MRFGSIQKSVIPVLVCLAVAGCFKSSEERANEHYENGVRLLAEGDQDRAMIEFRNTLKYAQTDVNARRQIAQIFKEKNNRIATYRNYLHVAEQLPEDLEARTILSELAFESRNWEEFERHSAAAIEIDDEDIRVKAIALGADYRIATLAEDEPGRKALLVKAETLHDEVEDSHILRQLLIDGYVRDEKYDLALEVIDQAIAARPDNLEIYNSKVAILARLGREDEVGVELRKIVDLFPEDENAKSTFLRYMLARGQTEQAEEFMRGLVAEADEAAKPDLYTNLVQFILRLKGPEAALSELEAEIARQPDEDRLRALRATINYDAGNRSEGIEEIQNILAAETPNLTPVVLANVKVALAKMLVADGNEVGARQLIEEVLEADSTVVGALKMQATWMIRDDQTNDAINTLRTVLDEAPEDFEAMTAMAEAHQRAGNKNLMQNFLSLAVEASGNAPEQSLRYARVLVSDDKPLQAESVLINSLRIAPGNVPVLGLLGQIYLRVEDFPRAQQVVDTLLALETAEAVGQANGLNVELLARQSGSDQALAFLENLAAQDGNSAIPAKLGVLQTRLRAGETDAALSYAKTLVEEEPDNLVFRNALALVYSSLRQYEEATVELNTLLDINPKLIPVWLQLARVKLAQGDRDAAIEVVDRGLIALPDAPDLLWGKASFLQQSGDVDGALEIYDRLYDRFSASLVIANNLASLLSTHRTDEASLQRAQTIARRLKDTDVPAFQDTYGWLLHLNGDSEAALEYLEPAAEALSQDVTVQLHLGMIYAELGRRDDALTQLRSMVALAGPLGDKVLVERAQAKISELEAQ